MFICTNCNKEHPRFAAKCSACWEYWTVVEREDMFSSQKAKKKININPSDIKAKTIDEIEEVAWETPKISLTSLELNKFFWNWLTLGSVNLISWEPWVWKSTFLIQLPSYIKDGKDFPVLYMSWEESEQQIGNRLKRIGLKDVDVRIYFNDSLEKALYAIEKYKPKLLIVDSIQTLYSTEVDGNKGWPRQTKYCLQEIISTAKSQNITVFIVWHVTKEWDVSGSKFLEHMVDSVFFIEGQGERGSQFKTLKAFKNRFGSTQELVCFEMEGDWIKIIEPTIASTYFIKESTVEVPWCSLGVVKEGNQLFLTEIQSLVWPSEFSFPKRVITAFNNDRFSVLIATIREVLGLQLWEKDIYVNIINNSSTNKGVDSLDLSIIASIISKISKIPLKDKIFLGKVGLLGEIRAVEGQKSILKWLQNLGFKNIISSENLSNIKELKDIIFKN